MSIKLSVIIPTYNRANYLSQCLHRVLSSNYENLEVIVSDNASQDDTQTVVSSFTDARLRRYRNNTNIGAELNILKLLEYVSGEYIVFLTDDAYLREGALSEIAEIIHSYPEVGVILHALSLLSAKTNQHARDLIDYPESKLFSSTEESLTALVWVAGTLNTIVIRSDLLDLDGYKRHMDCLLPQVYLVGSAMKRAPTYYTDSRLIIQRLGCKVVEAVPWWERVRKYEMMLGKMDIVKDLLAKSNEKCLADKIICQMVEKTIQSVLFDSRQQSMKVLLRQSFSLLRIPQVRRTRAFWVSLFIVLGINPITRVIWDKVLGLKLFAAVKTYVSRKLAL